MTNIEKVTNIESTVEHFFLEDIHIYNGDNQYEWRFIGFGDKVNWCEVFDYRWYDDGWNYAYSTYGDYNNIQFGNENDVHTFTPLHQLTGKIELSTEELVEELRRRGVVTQGNIIKS